MVLVLLGVSVSSCAVALVTVELPNVSFSSIMKSLFSFLFTIPIEKVKFGEFSSLCVVCVCDGLASMNEVFTLSHVG